MLPGQGRRTQIHGVPISERAIDEDGNPLPWALEGPDELRNPRRAPEEKGPFGTGGRRGKSRTKTPTPAKKEDPNLLYFDQALAFDRNKKAQAALEEQAQNTASARSRSALTVLGSNANSTAINTTPEPVEVALYGFQSEKQYAAIEHFEKISRGLICEDYPRQPPFERMRYQSSINITKANLSRSLTREESLKARNYAGGHTWIKVTFDSRQAADRAIYYSPQELNGHWVYAELYKGVAPVEDAGIPVTADDRDQGLLGASKPTRNVSQTLRPSSSAQFTSASNGAQRAVATLPRSFTATTVFQAKPPESSSSFSSSTASSATATSYPSLSRSTSEAGLASSSSISTSQPTDCVVSCRLIPGATRAVLRPAEEALLPQPSWSQHIITQLPFARWYNGDIIGDQVPRLDNGEFDWMRASFWWKICYWLDTNIGTNLCGMGD
ncbi:MAG: hypothetical protein M1836_004738 [Candelina mexicana]|nr:MAG: hypothetical protein M1836_004738 [Candelina mexicana]